MYTYLSLAFAIRIVDLNLRPSKNFANGEVTDLVSGGHCCGTCMEREKKRGRTREKASSL
jgi:hypothetical protein